MRSSPQACDSRLIHDPIGLYRGLQALLHASSIRAVLTSGKACVEYGLQQNTKDIDWILDADGIAGVVELFGDLDRLADLIPQPRRHRHRYHGVFAPNRPLRPAVTALAVGNVGKQRDPATGGHGGDGHGSEGCCGGRRGAMKQTSFTPTFALQVGVYDSGIDVAGRAALVAMIEELRLTPGGRKRSSVGGWRSEGNIFDVIIHVREHSERIGRLREVERACQAA